MTVKELIEELGKYPKSMTIYFYLPDRWTDENEIKDMSISELIEGESHLMISIDRC